MSAPVTVSRQCEGCGAPLEGRRRQTRTCSNRCRQRALRLPRARARRQAYELRRAKRRQVVELTPELRAWLRAEIDHRRRLELERLRDRDRDLFVEEAIR
jgi:hypothetical protein